MRETGRGMQGKKGNHAASDAALVESARGGDQRAFAELWRRHYQAGVRVAHQFTSSLDADDLVSEAFTRIYKTVLAGGGPTGAFRPYLYTSIRNLASTWGAASRDVQVDDIDDFSDPATVDDPISTALDRTLTARAFRSLPERWQSVLWYTEVEGLDPHEVAPLLGMTANAVAALSYRAREGLRKAWLQAHVSDAAASGECRWALTHLGDHARHALTPRDSERLAFHLVTCAKCSIISEEVEEVGSRLALVMLPILLGGVAGGGMLASFGGSSAATAATSAAVPAVPASIAASTAAVGVAGAASVTAPAVLVGALAVAVAVGGSAVAFTPAHDAPLAYPTSTSVAPDPLPDASAVTPVAPLPTALPSSGPAPDDPANIPGAVLDGTVEGLAETIDDVGEVLDAVAEPIADTSVSLDLFGTATPGAHLSLEAAGQVYATSTVNPDGSFAISVTALPSGLDSLDLVQTVDRSYLAGLVEVGPLGGVLGSLDELINALIRPLSLSSGGSEVSVTVIG